MNPIDRDEQIKALKGGARIADPQHPDCVLVLDDAEVEVLQHFNEARRLTAHGKGTVPLSDYVHTMKIAMTNWNLRRSVERMTPEVDPQGALGEGVG